MKNKKSTIIPLAPLIDPYGFIRNNSVNMHDILGKQDNECPKTCGPDITDDFSMYLAETYVKYSPNSFRHILPYVMLDPQIEAQRVIWMFMNGSDIDFIYNGVIKGCSSSAGKCKGTVRICGTCVHTSAASNTLYGFVANAIRMQFATAAGGATALDSIMKRRWPAEGAVQYAAYRLGYDLWDWYDNGNLAGLNYNSVCSVINASSYKGQSSIKQIGSNFSECTDCGKSSIGDRRFFKHNGKFVP
jgi:hypothetical protein